MHALSGSLERVVNDVCYSAHLASRAPARRREPRTAFGLLALPPGGLSVPRDDALLMTGQAADVCRRELVGRRRTGGCWAACPARPDEGGATLILRRAKPALGICPFFCDPKTKPC